MALRSRTKKPNSSSRPRIWRLNAGCETCSFNATLETFASSATPMNEWLNKDKSSMRYQFNMVTPKDYNKFFGELRKGNLAGFRSVVDVAMRKAAGDKD